MPNAAAIDTPAHRRSQPARQARTNPPRSSSLVASGREPLDGGHHGDQPIDIFPAITHFADAMTALPKDMIRHFTLLKEVDAKIFQPEDRLFNLVAAAQNSWRSDTTAANSAAGSVTGFLNAPVAQDTVATAAAGNTAQAADGQAGVAPSVYDPSNFPRRQLFRQTAVQIQELLVSLEEKNHVISTANEALTRHLSRVDDVWPHLLNEFSDEAKWGSSTHWAYPENRQGKSSLAERTRRDGAAAISAAAQALADEAAARSDARKQAVQAKKSMRTAIHPLESDFDDHEAKPVKRSHAGKGKKAAEAAATGLGISTLSSANGNPPQKRRKVEKPVNGGAPMERALSGVFGANTNSHKAKTNSPRETPVPEGTKKRKALPSASGQTKKRTGPGMSPSVTSSPVLSNLPEPKMTARASPAPTTAPRPAASRARANSTQSAAENGKAKPAPVPSKDKPNTKTQHTPDPVIPNRPNEAKLLKDNSAPIKVEPARREPDKVDANTTAPAAAETKLETAKAAHEERRKSESVPVLPATMATVTTKSGRASKPSTPALRQYEDAVAVATSRPRSSRTNDNVSNNSNGNHAKKHAKRASTASAALAAKIAAEEDTTSSVPGEEDDNEIDGDEPTYCYCNGVSYGEMVACDSDDCTREWFHLACVGLKKAPGQNTKWYCEDCKKRLQVNGKKANGR